MIGLKLRIRIESVFVVISIHPFYAYLSVSSMAITFNCTQCGKSYTIDDSLAGKHAKCSCGTEMTVPAPSAPRLPQRQVGGQQGDLMALDGTIGIISLVVALIMSIVVLIGLPIGIWGIIVLNDVNVKVAFRRG